MRITHAWARVGQDSWLEPFLDSLRGTENLVESQNQCDPAALAMNLTVTVTLDEVDCGDASSREDLTRTLCENVAKIVGLPIAAKRL